MKAIVYTKYGSPDVLKLEEVEKPSPRDDEVLVKVSAASLNAYDLHLLRARPFLVRLMGLGFFSPKNHILGADISGRVEEIGKNVKQLRPGDEVFGDMAGSGSGSLAEYVCARENVFVIKPANMTFEEAAAVPMAAVTALQGLRNKGEIRPGQKVLINGASGGVGTFAVQIAKSFGAEVTAVCSTGNSELARSMGADHVIDYAQTDFTRNGQQYDLILGANGYHSIFAYRRALSPHGRYVMSGGSNAQMFQGMLLGPFVSKKGGKKLGSIGAKPDREALSFLKQLLVEKKVAPVIDRRYPLEKAAEAFRYLESGHAKGKVIITLTGVVDG